MKRSPDIFTPSMFEPEKHPGYKTEGKSKITDAAGNVRDDDLNLVKEAPGEALLLARRRYPGLTDAQLRFYVPMYERELKNRNRNNPAERR